MSETSRNDKDETSKHNSKQFLHILNSILSGMSKTKTIINI